MKMFERGIKVMYFAYLLKEFFRCWTYRSVEFCCF